jgi:uncharacterized membrane protein
VRGFLHTVLLVFAATNIGGLDLSTSLPKDLLQRMGTFGISNYLTGIMLILLGWKARPLALVVLGVIPVVYGIGMVAININSAPYAHTQAAWDGTTFMMVYLAVCVIIFIVGVLTILSRRKNEDELDQA